MSFRERMHPKVSKAEIEVFKQLSAAGLTQGMVTQQLIILKATLPDFMWAEKRKVVYLDGIPVHRKDKQVRKDEEIDELLELQGWGVLRIPYDPPLSEKRLAEVVEQIRGFVGGV